MEVTRRLAKVLVGFSLLTLSAGSMQAQRLGLVAGITRSSLRSSEELAFERKNGTSFGASLQLPFREDFALQPEVMFMNKGSKFSEGAYVTTSTVQLDYLEVPILLRYNLRRGHAIPHVYAGPSVGFNVGCKLMITGPRNLPETDCKNDNFEPKSLDYGLIFGGGFDVGTHGIGATIGMRYGLGLADVRDDSNAEFRKRASNGVVTMYVGLLLGSFKK